MLLRETIRKSKVLFYKTLRNFKSFFLGGYQKLPRSLSFNPFLGRSGNARTYTSDQFYNEFYDILQSDLNRIKRFDDSCMTSMSREPAIARGDAATVSSESLESFANQNLPKSIIKEKVKVKVKKDKVSSQMEDFDSKNMNEGAHQHVLAQKMKELEMIDSGDVEQVLDIEEALHYYSRLKSPVYLDIVDKFFMDMHSDFSFPQSSLTIKHSHSRGKLGSIRL